MHTLTDNDGFMSRCLGNSTHPAHPELAHSELVLPKLALLILSLPIMAFPIFALPILALPSLALHVLALPVLALLKLAHLKVGPAQPESAHPEPAQRDRAQPECAQPSDPTPATSSSHNLPYSSVDIPGVRRFSKTCMTPSAGISDGQLVRRTVASSHQSLGQPVWGEFYSLHS
jgi:hypothetical protein